MILLRQGVEIYKSFGVIFLTFTNNITVSFSCFYCQFWVYLVFNLVSF